jgi:glutamine synthetase
MLDYGLTIEACNMENGPGQFEMNLRYADPLAAADAAFLFKAGVKEIAARNDLVATFMAKPHPVWSGNSCHFHLSLAGDDGRNRFFDERAPWRQVKEDRAACAETLLDLLYVIDALKVLFAPFLPFSSARLHALLGYEGDLASQGWRAQSPPPGQALPPPKPLFVKLDEKAEN